MKIFQYKIKILKITQPILKTLLITLLISVVFTSCDNKKKAPDDDKKEKVANDKIDNIEDADHTIDLKLVKGSETIEYSDAVSINGGGALYNDQKSFDSEQENRDRKIMMFIGKKYTRGKAGIFGIIRVDENWKPFTNIKGGDKRASTLSIRPKENGDEFVGVSGTMTFSDLKFALTMPTSGATSFTLDFEGDFQKNGNKEDVYRGSGTIVISPEKAMGVYKEK